MSLVPVVILVKPLLCFFFVWMQTEGSESMCAREQRMPTDAGYLD